MEIAIFGAGVAGLSAAIALRQKGFDVRVYERRDSPSQMGAGVVLWPNAAWVLEQLGVLDFLASLAGQPVQMRRISSSGEDLGSIDITGINRHLGSPSLAILRRDLQRGLTARLESLGVSVRYGHAVEDVDAGAGGKAGARFRNGSRVEADVLVGADGRMASVARRFVHGDNTPRYQGFINWIGVCESGRDLFDPTGIHDYWGTGARFGIVPISARRVYWAGGVASAGIGPRDRQRYLEELQAVFSSWPDSVRVALEHATPGSINKIYVHDHDPVTIWHRGNLIMIGDAAHAPLPTSGQGACQALEDAWHLAELLAQDSQNPQQVFTRFTELRYEKTAGIIAAARSFAASLFHTNPEYCRRRNENSRKADFAAVAAGMAGLWGRGLPLPTRP
jgi:FAD-dependent urate hydroxylase